LPAVLAVHALLGLLYTLSNEICGGEDICYETVVDWAMLVKEIAGYYKDAKK